MEFLGAVGKKSFAGGKPTVDFFRVLYFFRKLDVAVLNLFHEYLAAVGSCPGLSMRGLFQQALAWNQRQRTAKVADTHVEDYWALLKEW